MKTIVIRLSSTDEKTKSKAKKKAAGFSGVSSFQMKGQNLILIGEGVDSMKLMKMLKKKVDSNADLLSVSSGRDFNRHIEHSDGFGYDYQNQNMGFEAGNFTRNSFDGSYPRKSFDASYPRMSFEANYPRMSFDGPASAYDDYPRTPMWSYNGSLGYYPSTPRVYEVHHVGSPDRSSCTIM